MIISSDMVRERNLSICAGCQPKNWQAGYSQNSKSKFRRDEMKFSTKYGEIEVSSQAIKQLIREAIINSYGIVDLSNASLMSQFASLFSETDKGIKLIDDGKNVKVDVYVIAEYGINVMQVGKNLQDAIIYNLKFYVGMNPTEVNIHIVDINF
ncbi:MAG: hypothetical protein C0176_02730 [Mesoaciditoga sp.]|nr:MAG: hypothetical protein C0185_01330 [Mesoaciditoga sp.]PMP80346.1 MAG: hypothetical protein C0176_02730 [Mesoaciditoga sp.]HEU25067.1 Asp23/Gls24 family envelope stress response protein [Mesoaciditoga lauensis]